MDTPNAAAIETPVRIKATRSSIHHLRVGVLLTTQTPNTKNGVNIASAIK
jgi:hypothetical protein